MEIKVSFFGALTDVTGTIVRAYSGVNSLSELMTRLYDDYPEIAHYKYRIAINSKLTTEREYQFVSGDEVAFIPPFVGG